MSDVQDLRQRRQALEAKLSELGEQRERAFRTNSDARSLQRAGLADHTAGEMQELADQETAGDSAMTELRREIELIDGQLGRGHQSGGAKGTRSLVRWLRK